jgi:HSP20 family protein
MYPSMRVPGDLFADLEQFQDRLDELLGGRAASSGIRAVGRAGAFPALNVGTWAEALEIYAFAPGIDPQSIDVSVEKGLLTLKGERTSGPPENDAQTTAYASERFRGAFRRVVTLPDDADSSRVDASYKNGVLKIVIPKRESAKPRRIAIGQGQ